MSKRDEGLKALAKQINECAKKEKIARRQRECEEREKETNKRKAEEIFNNWLKSYEVKAREATHIIWGWYREFIATSIFQKFVRALHDSDKSRIRISKIVECLKPSRHSLHHFKEIQLLTVNMDQSLFVHNCIKYGKSYEIRGIEDLLVYVEWPILIEIAATITDETIWEIIKIS
ncbi:MAG: hypothetical protein HYW79_02610 [Parcubacteria group bacterium]|nr:hypothetical protein [Parcubacteria group bacterium]